MSAGVQKMVRSDIGASGVMFTMDTESGFDDAVFITSSYGLGEAVVQGAVNPDEFYVYKPALRAGRPAILKRGIGGKAIKMIYTSDRTVGKTTEFVDVPEAERGLLSPDRRGGDRAGPPGAGIEDHYGRPMDIEWGKDGGDGQSLHPAGATGDGAVARGQPDGAAVPAERQGRGADRGSGDRAEDRGRSGPGAQLGGTDAQLRARGGAGGRHDRSRLGADHEARLGDRHQPGRTDLPRSDHRPRARDPGGGRHRQRDPGAGRGSAGHRLLRRGRHRLRLLTAYWTSPSEHGAGDDAGHPGQDHDERRHPRSGVLRSRGCRTPVSGLARLEFIINRQIGIHPKALLDLDTLEEPLKSQIAEAVAAYDSPRDYFVTRVAEGVSMLAAAFAPEPVIVRMCDFKSNEYANLVGGELYEPHEENPMIGYRGASRYLSPEFADCFAMECEALNYVRDEMGLTNVKIMIPFVRTLAEAEGVIDLLASTAWTGARTGCR